MCYTIVHTPNFSSRINRIMNEKKYNEHYLTCTWNNVTESSSICTRMANFLPLRLAVEAVPSTPDGVLSECVILPVAGAGPIESNDIFFCLVLVLFRWVTNSLFMRVAVCVCRMRWFAFLVCWLARNSFSNIYVERLHKKYMCIVNSQAHQKKVYSFQKTAIQWMLIQWDGSIRFFLWLYDFVVILKLEMRQVASEKKKKKVKRKTETEQRKYVCPRKTLAINNEKKSIKRYISLCVKWKNIRIIQFTFGSEKSVNFFHRKFDPHNIIL